jgi:hypothetical protein
MEYRFNAEVWERLSNAERAKRCRLMAAEARKLAEKAVGRVGEDYLAIAANWEQLAADIDLSSSSTVAEAWPAAKRAS